MVLEVFGMPTSQCATAQLPFLVGEAWEHIARQPRNVHICGEVTAVLGFQSLLSADCRPGRTRSSSRPAGPLFRSCSTRLGLFVNDGRAAVVMSVQCGCLKADAAGRDLFRCGIFSSCYVAAQSSATTRLPVARPQFIERDKQWFGRGSSHGVWSSSLVMKPLRHAAPCRHKRAETTRCRRLVQRRRSRPVFSCVRS